MRSGSAIGALGTEGGGGDPVRGCDSRGWHGSGGADHGNRPIEHEIALSSVRARGRGGSRGHGDPRGRTDDEGRYRRPTASQNRTYWHGPCLSLGVCCYNSYYTFRELIA